MYRCHLVAVSLLGCASATAAQPSPLRADEMPGMERMPAGSTLRADWLGTWDDEVVAICTADCLDALNSCSAGVLNGTA